MKKSLGNKGLNMIDLIIFLLAEGYTDSFTEALEMLGIKEKPKGDLWLQCASTKRDEYILPVL